jgi:hypothetical protein
MVSIHAFIPAMNESAISHDRSSYRCTIRRAARWSPTVRKKRSRPSVIRLKFSDRRPVAKRSRKSICPKRSEATT